MGRGWEGRLGLHNVGKLNLRPPPTPQTARIPAEATFSVEGKIHLGTKAPTKKTVGEKKVMMTTIVISSPRICRPKLALSRIWDFNSH